jgi:DNA-binding SARP family transcriptional activator
MPFTLNQNIKTIPPQLPPNTIPRIDLEHHLIENINKRLILVVAGGGWGKSTFLSSYAQSSKHSTLWYNIDPSDREPRTFLSMLAWGISTTIPETRDSLVPVQKELSTGLPDLLPAVKNLANSVLRLLPKKFIIILDDYYLAGDRKPLNKTMDQFISLAPLNLQLIISTRQTPKISHARLRLQGDMLEINADKLKFSADELKQYIDREFSVSHMPEQVERTLEITEGWPISIKLIAGQKFDAWTATPSDFPSGAGSHQKLMSDYFQEQYFSQIPPRVQSYLLYSSIFSCFSAGLCRELLGWEDAEADLAKLSESGLLIATVNPKETVYRYHHLFLAFLSERLKRINDNKSLMSLRERAAAYLLMKGMWNDSFQLYVDNKDYRNASIVLKQNINDLFMGQAWQVLWRIEEIPKQKLDRHLPLLFARGWSLFLSGRWEDAMQSLEKVRMEAKTETNILLYGLALRVLMNIRFYQDEYVASEILAREYLRHLPAESAHSVAVRNQLAVILMHLGKTDEAAREWDGLASSPLYAQNQQVAVEIDLLRGFNYYFILGQFSRGVELVNKANHYFRSNDCSGRYGISLMLKGTILYETGEFDKSQETFGECISDMRRKGYISSLGLAYAMASVVAFENQDYRRGADLLRSINQMFKEGTGIRFWKRNLLHCAEAMDSFRRGDMDGFLFGADIAMSFIEEKDLWGDRYIFGCPIATRYAASGRSDAAIALLKNVIQGVTARGSVFWEARSRFLLSGILFDEGILEGAILQLKKGIDIAKRGGYDFLFLKKDRVLSRKMLPLALSHKIQPEYVAFLLANLNINHENPLISFLDHPDPELRLIALRELSRTGCWESEAALTRLIKDDDQQVRKAAHTALQHILTLAPDPLHVKLLGEFQLMKGERIIPGSSWRRKAAKSLFKYLICHNDVEIPVEHLISVLYDCLEFADARKLLHQAVTVIRKILEPGITPKRESRYLKYHDGIYRFLLPKDSSIDVAEFERFCQAARAAKDEKDTHLAVDLYSKAIGLYKGEFLANDPYDAWALAIRERIGGLYRSALHETATDHFQRFDFDSCIQILQRLIENDIWREEAYLLMMRCYFALGDRPKLIETYNTCCRALKTDLGITPNRQLTELYHQALHRT